MEIVSVGQFASPEGSMPATQLAPSLAWKTVKVIGKVAAGASAVFVLGLASLIATNGLGSVQALSAYVEPAQRITPAAPGMRWVQAPTSAFVEAGRTPEGGLDIRQMMQAWQNAGMSGFDAHKAMEMVGRMRPVLMGRDDPLAAAEHTVAMSQAAHQIAQAFPEVLSNLAQGKTAPLQSEDEIERWVEAIDSTELSLSHDLSLLGSNKGSSLEQNIAKRLAWNQDNPSNQQGIPRLAQLSMDEHGSYSSVHLIDILQRAGVEAYVADNIIEVLIEATAPLQGLPLATVKEMLKESADVDLHMVDRLTPELISNIAAAAASENFQAPLPADSSAKDWQQLRAQVQEDVLASTAVASTANKPPVSMPQATKALEDAVLETGLRSLSPSLWQWQSPQMVMELANNLKTANTELSHAMGWSGKVLGLDGRLELSMGPITQTSDSSRGASAIVSADTSGRVQMVSSFEYLGHEYFHVWDHVAAREALVNPSGRPLTENAQLLRTMRDPSVKLAIRNLNESLNDGSPQWQDHREKADDRAETRYFTKGTEAGAYAFSAFLTNSGAKLLANPAAHTGNYLEPQSMPSIEEQAHQRPFFENLFASTAHLKLSGGVASLSSKFQMKSVEQWRAERSTVDALRTPERRPTVR